MIDKNSHKMNNSKHWIMESFWKGLTQQKEKTNRKGRNSKYWTLDWYGFSTQNKLKKSKYFESRQS